MAFKKKRTTSKVKPKKRTSTRVKPRKKAATRKKAKPRTTVKRKTTTKRKSTTKRKTTTKRSSKTGGTMPKKRRSTKKSTKRRSSSRPKTKLKDVILNVVTMLGGGVAASVAANKLPITNTKARAFVPLGIGAAAVMLGAKKKKSTAVALGTGMMLVGGLSAIRANFPGVPLLAGEDPDVLEIMGEMDLVEGENDYYVPQLEYAGDPDDLDGEEYYIEGEDDDLDGNVYDLDGEEYYIDGEDDDLDGDMYELSGAEYPTPASM